MKLEEKLVALRKEKGLTQLQLAEMLNVSRQAVSRWEGGLAVPSLENLKYLGNLYNVPLGFSRQYKECILRPDGQEIGVFLHLCCPVQHSAESILRRLSFHPQP